MTEITLHQVEQDLITLRRHRLALEGFHQLMEGREVITGPTAVAMSIAMEDANPEEAEEKGVTGKDIATGLKKVAVTVKNIIKWLLRTIGSLVERLGIVMKKLGAKGKAVEQKAKTLPEAAKEKLGSPEATVPPKESVSEDAPKVTLDLSMLSIDGKFVGADIEQVNNVIKMGAWINGDYPKMFDTVMSNVERLAKSHMADETSEAFFKGLSSMLASTVKPPSIQLASENFAPSVHNGDESVNTVPLMGDRGLVMFNPRKTDSLNSDRPVDMLREFFILSFPEYSTKQDAPESAQTPDYQSIIKMINMINKSIDDNNDGAGAVKSLLDKRIASTNQLVEELEAKDTKGARGEIIEAIGIMLQRFAALLPEVHGWYSRTVNQELGYLGLSMDSVDTVEI